METSQEKTIQVGDILVNYKIAGVGRPILILHGWGSSTERWTKAQGLLAAKGYQVIVPDLPGFGKTPAPSIIWGVEEYAEFVQKFIDLLTSEVNKSGKVVLVGHSFGGQIAVYFATIYPEKVEKLIPIAAAAIRHEPSAKAKVFAAIAGVTPAPVKKMAAVAMRKSDYGKAHGIMKDIMRKVIQQDLTAEFSKIKAPTLIIWGDKDTDTPIKDAYVMHELIPNSRLEIIKGVGHRVNFEVPEKLAQSIWNWLS